MSKPLRAYGGDSSSILKAVSPYLSQFPVLVSEINDAAKYKYQQLA